MAVTGFERVPRAAVVASLIATSARAFVGDRSEGGNLGQPSLPPRRAPLCRRRHSRMARRFEELANECDHDAVFALTYLRTTEVFRDTALTLGYDDVRSVTRQDALFADYYFRAYDARQHAARFRDR